ncbi:bifunctional 3-phenylpropionate/cinnamic acid dioxygenase ferredoxin subunit [Micropruina sp.]|uniref:bifunctional 3-phenylpropionate/cinnamic acid dioxygenase ferredoxin subunit n=1 Tax=Micropruina sp. TaxID=2737536 RepID=UPI00261A2C92|nr:bifunctional 3-phenylpropionate/cinnamic acid dioxygenase ferredoxin subunit [Micropruina sp.]
MLRICSLSELVEDEGVRFDTVTPPIAVFLTSAGEVYAIDDTCTHQDASLAEGWVEDCRVECPLHASTFSLLTGDVDSPPARRGVRAHRIEVVGDDVYVQLSALAPNLPPGVEY